MTVNTDMTTNRNPGDQTLGCLLPHWFTAQVAADVAAEVVHRFEAADPPVPNEALIRQILSFIEVHPERWDQDAFLGVGECGTVGCFAGWAVLLSTYTEDLDRIDAVFASQVKHPLRDGEIVTPASSAITAPINKGRARRALGLTYDQFAAIYGFINVRVENDLRQPTFAELCQKVKDVTGIDYKNGETIDMEDE